LLTLNCLIDIAMGKYEIADVEETKRTRKKLTPVRGRIVFGKGRVSSKDNSLDWAEEITRREAEGSEEDNKVCISCTIVLG
jgi:hypothetical protein